MANRTGVTKFLENSGYIKREDPIGSSAGQNNIDHDIDYDINYDCNNDNKFLMVGMACVVMLFLTQFVQSTLIFLLEYLVLKVCLISVFGYFYGLDNGVSKLNNYHSLFNHFLKERCRVSYQYLLTVYNKKMQ